ncbi:MAG: hypothetical protein LRZ84_24525 [Desertifilum sp.]|nr:hypothetical protein [Desertifilum sp.]
MKLKHYLTIFSLALLIVFLSITINKAENSPIENLPDGIYLYGETAEPNQAGEHYIVFRKSNDRLMGFSYYRNTSENFCFNGVVTGNVLSNVTFSETSVPDPDRPLTVSLSTGHSWDLSKFIPVNGTDGQVNAETEIERCTQLLQGSVTQ